MFGASGTKKGVRVPYYFCSKRFNDHECEQDYVRGDLLETAIIEDVKSCRPALNNDPPLDVFGVLP